MVVVVEGHVAAGLVQHGEQGAHAAQPREVHDVLHLGGVLQGLDHHPRGGEVGLQGGRCVPLDLVDGGTQKSEENGWNKSGKARIMNQPFKVSFTKPLVVS